jgi:uncharacterized protein DUF2203
VSERVDWIRQARTGLQELGQRAADGLEALVPGLGGTYPGREVAGPLVKLSRALSELEAVEVVLRDVESGLVDFPAMRDGGEVYLCWRLDEDEISFWHPLDSGFAGREPL